MRARRRGDGQQVHEAHAFAAALGRAAEDLAALVARGRQRREIVGAVQHRAGGLDPVVHEHRLHLRDHRSFGAEVRVAPVRGVLRVSGPFVGDADAAGEADATVDDQQLAVRAVVEPSQLVPARLVEPAHLHARALHLRDLARVHLVAAEPVEQQMHLYACACALGERVGERLADRA